MGLYLIESSLQGIISTKEELNQKASDLQAALTETNSALIELQVSKDFSRSFFIIEAEDRNEATNTLRNAGIPVQLIKEVRLVGKDLEDVKKNKDVVNYLVEWNIPENITMEQYLERKKKNSVHYQEVPEVAFSRTYVCEDMTKCLCFYDAPDVAAVKRAREAVQTPIDSITEILTENN
ncbi:DUF4242 domain-containing protein [Schinkia azotoformans]|uniref:DUF4242 domain-containing protein n=1 Tax=Schinkia azotoformans TaxID=1454 RepID=UPI002DBEBE55|nr:DUF4242 domain-containing protein [Schinkia azotoformans]MEC1721517.1 DUF4242 domain-containing protein [Schinkia azotoformans]MED4352126.1 DUF4242 domain-containing protein [Schinkia azotoformans]MED4413684.1 DUF4242 domain-containing protein [Schinkia azotoformans]